MRRPLIIGVVAVAFVALLTAGSIAGAGSAVVIPPKTVNITGTNCAGGAEFCFKPALLTVPRGTKVVWKNPTTAPHTVTRCSVVLCGVSGGTGADPNFKSPTINPGKSFSFTFHKPGTYRYFCKVHGFTVMHGTITVK